MKRQRAWWRSLLLRLGFRSLLVPNDRKPLHPELSRADYGLPPREWT